jgi:histone-lysine N-methyltransferase SETMAR
MDQRSICLFLAMKRLSAQAIDNELVAVLGPDTVGYSTVTNYLRQRHFPSALRETIAWNPLGFPLIVTLPKGCTFNAEYYRDNILAALTQLQSEDDGRKLVVHVDNATAQKCRTFYEENGLRLAPHPPYSPDLVPSDFFLFDYVKERLKGMVFSSYEELLDEIGEVVTAIESETLTAVFEHWMKSMEWVSKNNRDYYP